MTSNISQPLWEDNWETKDERVFLLLFDKKSLLQPAPALMVLMLDLIKIAAKNSK